MYGAVCAYILYLLALDVTQALPPVMLCLDSCYIRFGRVFLVYVPLSGANCLHYLDMVLWVSLYISLICSPSLMAHARTRAHTHTHMIPL
jgi:hypothetical protein